MSIPITPYQTSITPYRTMPITNVSSGPLYGVIKHKPKPVHKCATPGFWVCLFSGIGDDSLFRCRECGKVWRRYGGWIPPILWDETSLHQWKSEGGEVEPHLLTVNGVAKDENEEDEEDEDHDEEDEDCECSSCTDYP